MTSLALRRALGVEPAVGAVLLTRLLPVLAAPATLGRLDLQQPNERDLSSSSNGRRDGMRCEGRAANREAGTRQIAPSDVRRS